MTHAATLARLEAAMSRLLAGQPTISDGELTVSNLCREAGVGRDSYYRCSEIVEKFTAAKTNIEARKPELIQLRDEVTELRRQARQQAQQAAEGRRELEELVKNYANQIQVLALRNAELEAECRRLRKHVEADRKVRPLRSTPSGAGEG
ncbi:hypothetical protein [Streptosporangium sp. NPDC001681]|uniref:hypothetical protein n=1 Tax=Streptosporangium sp. NPDC001681 TaxID=3154395 RepID=UPI0033165E31